MSADHGIFAGLSFLILDKDLDWPLEQVKGAIRANGGWITAGEAPFTHVVLSSSLWTDPGEEADDTWLMAIAYQNAEKRRDDDEDHGRIWLVPVEWLEESIIEQRRLPERDYDVQRVVEEEDRQYEERHLEYFRQQDMKNQRPAARSPDPAPAPEQDPEPDLTVKLVDLVLDNQVQGPLLEGEEEQPLPTPEAEGEKQQADLSALLAQFNLADVVDTGRNGGSENGDAHEAADGPDKAGPYAEPDPRAKEIGRDDLGEQQDSDGDVQPELATFQDDHEEAARPPVPNIRGNDAKPLASTPEREQRAYPREQTPFVALDPLLGLGSPLNDRFPLQAPASSTPKQEQLDSPSVTGNMSDVTDSDADEGPLPFRKALNRKAPRILDSDSEADAPRDRDDRTLLHRLVASAAPPPRVAPAQTAAAKVAPRRRASLATPPRRRLIKQRRAPATPDTSDSSEEDRPPQIFDGLVFYVHGEWAGWTRGKVKRVIGEHGGTISGQLTNACISHLITSEARWLTHAVNDADLTIRAFQTANKKNKKEDDEDHYRVWILPLEWVEESIAAGNCLPERSHDLERTHEAKEQKRAAEIAAGGRASDGKSRAGRGSRLKVEQKRAPTGAYQAQQQAVKSASTSLLKDTGGKSAARPGLAAAPAEILSTQGRDAAPPASDLDTEDDLAPLDLDELLRRHAVDPGDLAVGL